MSSHLATADKHWVLTCPGVPTACTSHPVLTPGRTASVQASWLGIAWLGEAAVAARYLECEAGGELFLEWERPVDLEEKMVSLVAVAILEMRAESRSADQTSFTQTAGKRTCSFGRSTVHTMA